MYAIKVTAIQWVDPHACGDPRRHFRVLYVFDDGFKTEKQCIAKLKDLSYDPRCFATVRFCKQWYAVNITDYHNFVVVSKENVIHKIKKFDDSIEMIPLDLVTAQNKPEAYDLVSARKKWASGIEKDLKKIDPKVKVRIAGAEVKNDPLMVNNIIVTFGREFFRTEICIRTNLYTAMVFSNYYNERSLNYVLERVVRLKHARFEYYNPFLGDKSKTYAEKDRRANSLLERCSSYEEIEE